jgi:hypothetical protein
MPTTALKKLFENEADELSHKAFARIGRFLEDQHLPASPENYTLAYRYVTEPQSPFAKAVKAWVADGVRLTQCDIEALSAAHSFQPAEACDPTAIKTEVKKSTLRRLERIRRVSAAVTREIEAVRSGL